MAARRLIEPHWLLKTHALRGRASSRLVGLLHDSMSAHGWLGGPVVAVALGGDVYLLDGHHRRVAARRAGLLVPVHLADITSLANFGYHSDQQVLAAHAEAGPDILRQSR